MATLVKGMGFISILTGGNSATSVLDLDGVLLIGVFFLIFYSSDLIGAPKKKKRI
jgi:hypothetical protein